MGLFETVFDQKFAEGVLNSLSKIRKELEVANEFKKQDLEVRQVELKLLEKLVDEK